MKKSSEYLGKEEFLSRGTIEKIIEQAQIDAYNQALEDAVKAAKVTWSKTFYTVVDKQSILNLKK